MTSPVSNTSGSHPLENAEVSTSSGAGWRDVFAGSASVMLKNPRRSRPPRPDASSNLVPNLDVAGYCFH